jgi:mycoredoxin
VTSHESDERVAEVVVYWRPGCLFCHSLRRRLRRAGVAHRLVNIWDDPTAAARVRAVAGGNETVPTVVVGPVALVNPGIRDVLAVAQTHAPAAVAGVKPAVGGPFRRWARSLRPVR